MDIKIVDNLTNIPEPQIDKEEELIDQILANQRSVGNMEILSAGSGSKSMYFDKNGLRLGNSNINTAAFSVTTEGVMTMRNGVIRILDDNNNVVIQLG